MLVQDEGVVVAPPAVTVQIGYGRVQVPCLLAGILLIFVLSLAGNASLAADPEDFDYTEITLSTDLIAAVVDIEDDLTMAGLLNSGGTESVRLIPTGTRGSASAPSDLTETKSEPQTEEATAADIQTVAIEAAESVSISLDNSASGQGSIFSELVAASAPDDTTESIAEDLDESSTLVAAVTADESVSRQDAMPTKQPITTETEATTISPVAADTSTVQPDIVHSEVAENTAEIDADPQSLVVLTSEPVSGNLEADTEAATDADNVILASNISPDINPQDEIEVSSTEAGIAADQAADLPSEITTADSLSSPVAMEPEEQIAALSQPVAELQDSAPAIAVDMASVDSLSPSVSTPVAEVVATNPEQTAQSETISETLTSDNEVRDEQPETIEQLAMATPATVSAVQPGADGVPLEQAIIPDAEERINEDEIILSWATAWSNNDTETYLSFYADDFVPANPGQSRSEWEDVRRKRLRNQDIRIIVSNAEIHSITADRVEVRFTQRYTSRSYKDRVIKSIEMVETDSGWKFLSEKTLEELPFR